jgi:hypothetical protein
VQARRHGDVATTMNTPRWLCSTWPGPWTDQRRAELPPV